MAMDKLIRETCHQEPGKPAGREDLIRTLWKRRPEELRQLAQTFADRKMNNLAQACRVIADMKS